MKKIIAVIPIRKGSQRVKNKNFKNFAGKNLLIHKIDILKKVKDIDEIVINTDSDEAIEISKEYNVNYFKREDFFASSECSNSDFWRNIAENTKSEFIMFTNCTSPLITHKTYSKIIKIYKDKIETNEFDSLNTVNELKEFLFLDSKPLNFETDKTPNSQDLPNIVKLNFAINILKTENMYNNKSLIGKKPYLYNLDEIEGLDINTEFEFSYAEYLFKKKYE